MSVPCKQRHYKYNERPPDCPDCKGPAWWNGKRHVCESRKQGDIVEHVQDLVRRRAKCRTEACPSSSWTVYEKDSYPHRGFSLGLVISAVGAVALAHATMTATAKMHGCSRDSVRRWVAWVERLAEPQDLMRACTRLEPRGLPGGLGTTGMPRAAVVLHLCDRFATLLAERGVKLAATGSTGLVRLLEEQLVRLGVVIWLTKSSPPLRVDLDGVLL